MFMATGYRSFLWLTPVMVIAGLLGRTLWVFRGSRNWPTADGTITSLDVQQRRDGEGRYSRAVFSYEFRDLDGNRNVGTWSKNFSTEAAARDFAAREMPMGKQVLVRFDPKNPDVSDLELDSFVYTDDRPTSLGL